MRQFLRALSLVGISASIGFATGGAIATFVGLGDSAREDAAYARGPSSRDARAGSQRFASTARPGDLDYGNASKGDLKRLSAKERQARIARGLPLVRIPVKKHRPTVQGLRHVDDIAEEEFARKVEGEYQTFFGPDDF